MKRSVSQLLKDGYRYMNLWPQHALLSAMFREILIIRLTKFALNAVPPIVIVSLYVQFNLLSSIYWSAAISVILLLISLPLQGLIWLGGRANTLLPPALASWYTEIGDKMRDSGMEVSAAERPVYGDMAVLLKQAFGQLDRASLQRLF